MTPKRHRITFLASALVVAAIAAPAASARPVDNGPINVIPNSPPSTSATQTSTQQRSVETSPQPRSVDVVRVPSDGRFHWGDAGIGAAAIFALAIIGLGGALVVSHRRQDRQATTA